MFGQTNIGARLMAYPNDKDGRIKHRGKLDGRNICQSEIVSQN